ncbi:MAG: hypothetical protein H7833_18450 [Magnetococcus sp. DMHC-1]|nr:hypothetical protein [Magnetococcales bacterium]
MGRQDSKIADAILLLAKDLSDPQILLANLSPRERLQLSQGLGDAFNTLDRIDQAFADFEEQGHGRMLQDGFHLPLFDGQKSRHGVEENSDWA